jgi:Mce-associated membrane protein
MAGGKPGKPNQPEGKSDAVRSDTAAGVGQGAATAAEESSDAVAESADAAARGKGAPGKGKKGHDAGDAKPAKTKPRINKAEPKSKKPKSKKPKSKKTRRKKARRGVDLSRLLAFPVLPGVVLLLATAAGCLKWQVSSMRAAQIASTESVAAAKDGAVALLSYQSDTAEKELRAARDRLTGTLKESYTQLIDQLVIPAAKEQHVSAVANIRATASVSATRRHAVALVFVDLAVTVGAEKPTGTASSVRMTLEKVDDRWLISGFDPI